MNSNNEFANIFNELNQTAVMNIMLILAGALLLIALGQRMLSWLGQ